MDIGSLPHGDEAFSTKRLPLPRLECNTSRDMATTKMGNDVHFWPGRRADKQGQRSPGAVVANGAPQPGQAGAPQAGITPDNQLASKGGHKPHGLQEEIQAVRRGGVGLKSSKKQYAASLDDAKKDVRNSLAVLRADARSKHQMDFETKEDAASADLQVIKGEWNHFHYVRLQKEEEVKDMTAHLSTVSGDVIEDQETLEELKPSRDELQREAALQETGVENESRKGSMYEHMELRAKETAVCASKEVDHLHLEVASLARDLQSLEIYLRETRRLRAKSEEALSWMQENYNARSEQRTERLGKRREQRDQVGRELAETRLKMKELKAQWRAEAERAALEEKHQQDKQLQHEKLAAQRELAEEEMRIKLERLAHTVGLKHRPDDQKPPIKASDSKILSVTQHSDSESEGWTPEGILLALQAVEQRREDVEKQIDALQAREASAWQALPEWRTKLQAARQGWTEMWKSKLEGSNMPPPEPSRTEELPAEAPVEPEEEGVSPQAQLDQAGKSLHGMQSRYEAVVKLLAGVTTGLAGLERLITTSAPGVQPIAADGSIVPISVPKTSSVASRNSKGSKRPSARVVGRTTQAAIRMHGGPDDGKGPSSRRPSVAVPASKKRDSVKAPENANDKRRNSNSDSSDLLAVGESEKDVDDIGGDMTPDGPLAEFEELQPYVLLSDGLKRCMETVLGVFAEASLERDQALTDVEADVHPMGIRPQKVRQPLGYLDEKEIPGKYTTKEGFAVAGPHINADEENDVIDDPEKRKRRGDSAGKPAV